MNPETDMALRQIDMQNDPGDVLLVKVHRGQLRTYVAVDALLGDHAVEAYNEGTRRDRQARYAPWVSTAPEDYAAGMRAVLGPALPGEVS